MSQEREGIWTKDIHGNYYDVSGTIIVNKKLKPIRAVEFKKDENSSWMILINYKHFFTIRNEIECNSTGNTLTRSQKRQKQQKQQDKALENIKAKLFPALGITNIFEFDEFN